VGKVGIIMPVGNILSIICVGISIAGVIFSFLAWFGLEWSRRKEIKRTKCQVTRIQFASRYLHRWTWFDYYMLFLFMFGFVFLLSDVIGVARQPDVFPSWHFGYVLIGIAILLHVFIYFLARYLFLLRSTERERHKREDVT
jgi:MFS family permease